MQLAKTDKARDALERRDPALSTRDRRILIVSDGRRSSEDLVAMLGEGVASAIRRLLQEGYLSAASVGLDAARASTPLPPLLRRSVASVEKRQELAQSTPPMTASPASSPSSNPAVPGPGSGGGTSAVPAATPRRSMVAARMYMLDMLQLLRHQEAGAHAERIRAAHGSDAVVACLLAALQHIRASTSPSYAERVTQRLAEALPIDCLPQLAAIAPDLMLPASQAG
jgi:hypothetical protein